MRLLHKKTLEFWEFYEEDIPPYVILSHRWRGLETTFQKFNTEKDLASDEWPAGTRKVMDFCQQVAHQDEEYVWVDTCCIDKTSSAGLQEAINSMFAWYRRSVVCYVYLDDVSIPQDGDQNVDDQLWKSEWFTRGWTLQELLAPHSHTFTDRHWKIIGSREELDEILESITGIGPDNYGPLPQRQKQSISTRMSWLSHRKTSRVEDLAYCMLGIFDINMTMMYGEGKKAFQRLQKEIVSVSDDESISLWTWDGRIPGVSPSLLKPRLLSPGLLATHPSCFQEAGRHHIEQSQYFERQAYRLTNKGSEIEICSTGAVQTGFLHKVPLNCVIDGKRAFIMLREYNNVLYLEPQARLLENTSPADAERYPPLRPFRHGGIRQREIPPNMSVFMLYISNMGLNLRREFGEGVSC